MGRGVGGVGVVYRVRPAARATRAAAWGNWLRRERPLTAGRRHSLDRGPLIGLQRSRACRPFVANDTTTCLRLMLSTISHQLSASPSPVLALPWAGLSMGRWPAGADGEGRRRRSLLFPCSLPLLPLNSHGAGLVAGLAGVGIEGGEGEVVHFFVVHGHEDLAALDAGVDHGGGLDGGAA